MKKVLFSFVVLLIITSCGKWKGEKNTDLTYYSEDYKEKEMTFLNVASSDIDALWVEFKSSTKDKNYDSYALIVKSNGDFVKELGSCEIDWENQITFHPQNGDSYLGDWIYGKEKYTISYELEDRTEDITFVYKEVKGCK